MSAPNPNTQPPTEEELAAVDTALAQLGGIEPDPSVVQATLERVQRGNVRRWVIGGALLAAAAGLVVVSADNLNNEPQVDDLGPLARDGSARQEEEQNKKLDDLLIKREETKAKPGPRNGIKKDSNVDGLLLDRFGERGEDTGVDGERRAFAWKVPIMQEPRGGDATIARNVRDDWKLSASGESTNRVRDPMASPNIVAVNSGTTPTSTSTTTLTADMDKTRQVAADDAARATAADVGEGYRYKSSTGGRKEGRRLKLGSAQDNRQRAVDGAKNLAQDANGRDNNGLGRNVSGLNGAKSDRADKLFAQGGKHSTAFRPVPEIVERTRGFEDKELSNALADGKKSQIVGGEVQLGFDAGALGGLGNAEGEEEERPRRSRLAVTDREETEKSKYEVQLNVRDEAKPREGQLSGDVQVANGKVAAKGKRTGGQVASSNDKDGDGFMDLPNDNAGGTQHAKLDSAPLANQRGRGWDTGGGDEGKRRLDTDDDERGQVPSGQVARASETERAADQPALVAANEPAKTPAFETLAKLDKKVEGLKQRVLRSKSRLNLLKESVSGRFDDSGYFDGWAPVRAETPIPAVGYFLNTYIPGDGRNAWLRQTLRAGLSRGGVVTDLGAELEPLEQPLDAPPKGSALALTVGASERGVDGPTRLTMQVALKAGEYAATRRAPLNMAMVVDLRGAADSETVRQSLWRLADTIAEARHLDDRMSLVVAAPSGPIVVTGAELNGAAARRALADGIQQVGTVNLAASIARAYKAVADGRRDDGLVGADMVVVATASGHVGGIGDMVRAWSAQGVTLSTVAVGADAARGSLSELARVGAGRRYVLDSPDIAASIARRELTTAGRAVARALRLEVKLAEGVKLFEVHGSRALSVAEKAHEKKVEEHIDLKVAATTGVEADRGDDGEGLQILIPAFYASDAHIVLFDVEVSGPGAVADVKLRYKDLVGMDNGLVTTRLSVGRGATPRGRLGEQVVTNLALHDIADSLTRAADAVQRGDTDAARAEIRPAVAMLRSRLAVGHSPKSAAALEADIAQLDRFSQLLGRGSEWRGIPAVSQQVTRALRYAASIKRRAR